MDRTSLADFLRRRRERLDPQEVGLSPTARRRTPGLRREEVAALAGMSVDYVVRLEQGRAPHPSDQMLTALARALRLGDDERDHLFVLAGSSPPLRTTRHAAVRSGVLHLLDAVSDSGMFVSSDLGRLLAANSLAVNLLGHGPGGVAREDSAVWQWFTDPASRERTPPEDYEDRSRVWASDLRAATTRRPDDPEVTGMVEALLQRSEEFAAVWARHEVAVRHADHKRIIHPQVGLLELDCETLVLPEADQRLVVLTASPGSAAYERLRLLRVIGEQAFDTV
ncbi:helix-turn-helix transcriptional regulator [Luteipulveratus mongoliensis]|uniref:XRE family transcriptional regulator n=1 Tax=Luteipulveratus mongoliensis TaxID=571913 RepID=A0A0K1JJG9_9MICO|nr:helix-turn-helix transcriptional regulator [Luteipulveratus mongoliensis]AKU16723.1 XRE family transcriptional regulator [Luteipulveratus mongoliensis]